MWSRFLAPASPDYAAELDTAGENLVVTDHTSDQKKNLWSRVHSHFALMRGFAFDMDITMKNFLPNSQTLTPRALRKLAEAEPMLTPDLSDRAINDKSKANWLAKSLVYLQTCIVQVVGRASTSAPLSLLEMNTFLYASCCLIIYLA